MKTTLALALLLLSSQAEAQLTALSGPAPKVPGISVPGSPAGFQGGADDCAAPHTHIGSGVQVGVPFTTGTTGATGQNEALCNFFGTTGIDNDVWFDWTATSSGYWRISTCGGTGVDTKVAVWPDHSPAGCPADGAALACNDDACGLQTAIVWSAAAGTTYTFQVGTFPGASGGSGTFDVTQTPPVPCGRYDDGTIEHALGLAAGGELGWMHAFECMGSVEAVSTAYFCAFPGSLDGNGSKIGLWVDLDCDGDPRTGMQLVETVHTVVMNCSHDGIFNTIPFTTPHPIPTGCSWIAASADHAQGEYPAPIDHHNPFPTAWFVGSTAGPGTLSYADLNANNIPPQPLSAAGVYGAWLLRAVGTEGCGDTASLCFGNGSAAPCGCGNEAPSGACTGCRNGLGIGALLTASGNASLSNDTVRLTASQVTAQPGLFFQGDTRLAGGDGVTFGDGIRCCGQNVIRLEVAFGQQPEPSSVSTTVIVSQHPGQNLMPGDSRCYQYWYRDPQGTPCGSGFNLSNGVQLVWGP